MFAVAALVITASVANAQIDRDTGIGIGAAVWYSQNCETQPLEGQQIMALFFISEGINEDNIIYQPGILEGYNGAEDLGCELTKLVMQSTDMYDLLY